MSKPIAVVCSDLHLQDRAPVARSAEPDWFEAMLRPIKKLREVADDYQIPVICAGDIFDYWKASPEIINFALHELPEMYAIPGQHDLPMHQMKDMGKSAFGTLVQTGKIKLLTYGVKHAIEGALLWGYHWGAELRVPKLDRSHLNVAVIHKFVWVKDHGFPGAPDTARAAVFREKMAGFDTLLFGDNHKPFYLEGRSADCPTVFNHGGFMRRKINEQDMRPALGLLMSDGTVDRIAQDVSQDLFLDAKEKVVFEEEERFLEDFLRELGDLGKTRLDFVEAVKHYLESRDISDGAKKLMLEAIHR